MVRGLVMIAVASVITSPWCCAVCCGRASGRCLAGPPAQKKRSPTTPRGLGSWPTTPAGASGTVAVYVSASEHHRQPPSGESAKTLPRVSYGVSTAIVKRMCG